MSRAVAERVAARRWRPAAAVVFVALLVVAAIAVVVAVADEANSPRRVTVRIPEGTAAAVADGREPGVVEDRIVLRAGDELELRNDDTRLHVLGPLSVAPGGRARTVFAAPARTDVTTSLRADGTVTIVVQATGAVSGTAGTTRR